MADVQTRTTDDRGVAFPVDPEGKRSTTATARDVLSEAAGAVDRPLAQAIRDESDWRSRYGVHLRALVAAEVRSGGAVEVARTGLDAVHRRFEFERDGARRLLTDAVRDDAGRSPAPSTHTIVGEDPQHVPTLSVPYRGQQLSGDALRRQLEDWVAGGIVEPSFADAIRAVMARPDWLDLSDVTVAVVGAGAEMGPLEALCGWRANVLAVDLPQATGRIEALARAGNATVHLPRLGPPADDGAPAAGADVTTATPELAAWLAAVDGPLVVGTYAYADGADHVRLSVAADALIDHLLEVRDEVSLAVLLTPTDVYAVPSTLVDQVRASALARRTPVHERLARQVSGGRLYRPSYAEVVACPDGTRFGLADSQVAQQGPNYALAKRLQRWRALAARADGVRSSVNVAPATSTRSVTSNRMLAAAYAGAGRFGVEVFEPATSRALMAALLVHDLRQDGASADPAATLRDPLELFSETAAHGGLWRTPWTPPSVLGLAAASGLARRGG